MNPDGLPFETSAGHRLPGPDELNYYTGQQDVINGCRQTFVATAIRLVDGP